MKINKRISKRKAQLINIIERIICKSWGLPRLPRGEYCAEDDVIAQKILAWEKRERARDRKEYHFFSYKKYRLIQILEMYFIKQYGMTGGRGQEYEGYWWDVAYLISTAVYQWLKENKRMFSHSSKGDKLSPGMGGFIKEVK